jgi:serine/threonine-protein kinase
VDRTIDNKYRLIRQLGAGGMGSVFEAEHTGVGRRVAVKLLHRTIVDADPKNLGRLQREARFAGTLDSPHIAHVSDVGIDPATQAPYLVLEYLEGVDLEQLLRVKGKLPCSLALRIAAQACMGLKRAHEAGVIHRDIKPANLFLSRRDDDIVVKVLDFGIAKPDSDELAKLDQSALTRTGTLIGSPLFMSPEQARGLKTIDKRADIWSLGVVLFNMLAGRTPNHEVEALGELILSICSVATPSVRDYAPETPIAVAEIVNKALSIPPDHRFANAGEMYEALVTALGSSAKGSARHAIELSELPMVEQAANEGRKASPRSISASGEVVPLALGRTEVPAIPSDSGEVPTSSAKTVASSPDLLPSAVAAAKLSTGSGERAASASPETGTHEAAPALASRPHAASVEGVVSPPESARPTGGHPRTFWVAAGVAAAIGVGAAYWAFGSASSSPAGPAVSAATAGEAPTTTTAPEVSPSAPAPSVTLEPSATAPVASTPEPALSAAPSASAAVSVVASGPRDPRHPTTTATASSRPPGPADTSTFGGRK